MFEHKKKEKSIIKAKRFGVKQLSMPSQRVAKVEIMKPSMIEEFSKVNELPQATMKLNKMLYYRISLKYPCTLKSMHGNNNTIELEDQEESVGKELILCHEIHQ
ncbi:hypothetical protein M9H77_30070 [Catharanthus roseus]|uniref:Uncharacterized protein n=1 Tax=Catharanthus roseus TaxID=4058 RepID=A0ACC0A0G5_CATRO|nr:hypothetical protein M9H77_30070 [Catharanthus roseus]